MYPNTIGKAGPTNWRRCVLSLFLGGARDALRRGQSRGPHRSRRQPAPLPGLRCGARSARRASPPRRPTPLARSEGGGGAHPHVPLGFVLEAGKQRRSAEALSNGGGIGPVPGTGGEGGGGLGAAPRDFFLAKRLGCPARRKPVNHRRLRRPAGKPGDWLPGISRPRAARRPETSCAPAAARGGAARQSGERRLAVSY
jgi:hypothetical protein